MKFSATGIEGALIVDVEPIEDERGLFARAWCGEELAEMGVSAVIAQTNLSFNRVAGTIRGMHWQQAPFEEAKFMRCVRGSIFDVIIDLRPDSETYMQWKGVILTAENRRALLVPEGCAHGFQALENDTEVIYQVSQAYRPDAERGARFDDPAFLIDWPLPVSVISDKDRSWPDFVPDREHRDPDIHGDSGT